jgi:hypothetical protein
MRQIQTQAEQTWVSPPVEAVDLDSEYHDELLRAMESAYAEDSFFKHILPAKGVPSTEYAGFTVHTTPLKEKSAARLIYTKGNAPRLCVPKGTMRGRTLRELIMEHCRSTLGHLGVRKTQEYTSKQFWWDSVNKDVILYCETCIPCHVSRRGITVL